MCPSTLDKEAPMVLSPDLLERARAAGGVLDEAERRALLARGEYHAAVRRLHLAGGSLREIAQALSLSHQRVQQIRRARRRHVVAADLAPEERPGGCRLHVVRPSPERGNQAHLRAERIHLRRVRGFGRTVRGRARGGRSVHWREGTRPVRPLHLLREAGGPRSATRHFAARSRLHRLPDGLQGDPRSSPGLTVWPRNLVYAGALPPQPLNGGPAAAEGTEPWLQATSLSSRSDRFRSW